MVKVLGIIYVWINNVNNLINVLGTAISDKKPANFCYGNTSTTLLKVGTPEFDRCTVISTNATPQYGSKTFVLYVCFLLRNSQKPSWLVWLYFVCELDLVLTNSIYARVRDSHTSV